MSDQQRILGYFIEEAKEHLETLEKGLMNLSEASEDSEQIDELFRAAHSVKGGGAMLGYGSIQKTAHRLEDAFKVFRDGKVNVDEKLESLFLSTFDVLQELVTRLESPEGLTEAEGKETLKSAEPRFKELQQHLDQCAQMPAVMADLGQPTAPEKTPEPAPERMTKPEESTFVSPLTEIRPLLLEMLQSFKEEDTPETRQHIWQICDRAREAEPENPNWAELVEAAKSAIANPQHSYTTLAPVVIKELKQGADYLELGEPEKITISETLDSLANRPLPQVLIPVEPNAAAELLKRIFNQEQLSQLQEKIGV